MLTGENERQSYERSIMMILARVGVGLKELMFLLRVEH